MNEKELLEQIDDKKFDELMLLLSPFLEEYDTISIRQEGDEVVVYGENIIGRTKVQ